MNIYKNYGQTARVEKNAEKRVVFSNVSAFTVKGVFSQSHFVQKGCLGNTQINGLMLSPH